MSNGGCEPVHNCTATLLRQGVAAFAPGLVRRSGRPLRWINRALGGPSVYLGARVAMLQVC